MILFDEIMILEPGKKVFLYFQDHNLLTEMYLIYSLNLTLSSRSRSSNSPIAPSQK